VVRRIGHHQHLAKLAESAPQSKTIRLLEVGGFDVSHTTNRGAKQKGLIGPPEMLQIYSGGKKYNCLLAGVSPVVFNESKFGVKIRNHSLTLAFSPRLVGLYCDIGTIWGRN